jgi:hypothetical protein
MSDPEPPVEGTVVVVDEVEVVVVVLVDVVVGTVPRGGPGRAPPGRKRAAAATAGVAEAREVEGLFRKRFIELVQWVERERPSAAITVEVRTMTVHAMTSMTIRGWNGLIRRLPGSPTGGVRLPMEEVSTRSAGQLESPRWSMPGCRVPSAPVS